MPDVIWKHAEQVDGAVTDKRCREQPDERSCTTISRANKERNHCHRDNQPENVPRYFEVLEQKEKKKTFD